MTVRPTFRPASSFERPSADVPATLEPVAEGVARTVRNAGKSSTQDKLEWLDAVAADHHRVNPTSFKVAFVVAQHINSRLRCAWPSQETLATKAGVSETTLRACLKALIGLGYLTQEKWGVKNNNRYRLRRP